MDRDWRPRRLADAPDAVILFDGVCVLCSRWGRFVIARDPKARFRFVPVQQPVGRDLAQRLGIDVECPETNAVILAGTAYFKSDAAIAVLSRLPRWRWTRVARLVPRRLRDALYDLVARNRYNWFGRTETCLLPTPDLARHFLQDAPASHGSAQSSA